MMAGKDDDMKMRTWTSVVPLFAMALCSFHAGAVKVTVDVADVRAEVPRTIYGTGMEDVNHEIYGGLDAQRLWDESFEEELPPQVIPYAPKGKGGIACGRQWEGLACGDGMFVRDTKVAHFGRASELLVPGTGSAGVANRGLNGWGVPCREGKKMLGHFFARGVVGELEVRLERADGRITYAKVLIPAPSWDDWTKVEFVLLPDRTDPAARFSVVATGGGRVWIDDAYLADEPTNDFGRIGCREDLVDGFRKEGLTFFRWGGSMVNAPEYLLKNMKGERRPYEGFWFKKSSCGFMVREFVQMADLLKLPCAFSIHAYDSTEDAVELATWLKRFDGLICVQIGNEECAGYTPAGGQPVMADIRRYCENLRRLVPAMRKANPKLVFAGAVMWQMKHMDLMEETFRLTDGYVEYWDIHMGAGDVKCGERARHALKTFREMITRINPKTTMKAAIFEENAHIHDMKRAIAHARNLEAVREAGDFVLTSCPANALQAYMNNDNGWDQGQIFYTTDKVWLQPCGWAQQMASVNHRDLLVAGRTDDKDVSISATRDREGKSVVLHLCNPTDVEKPMSFDFAAKGGFKLAKVTSLSAPSLEARNPPDDPDRISPKDMTEAFRASPALRPFSYTVVEFQVQ
jgi:alpha-L-arabinofuranosidase